MRYAAMSVGQRPSMVVSKTLRFVFLFVIAIWCGGATASEIFRVESITGITYASEAEAINAMRSKGLDQRDLVSCSVIKQTQLETITEYCIPGYPAVRPIYGITRAGRNFRSREDAVAYAEAQRGLPLKYYAFNCGQSGGTPFGCWQYSFPTEHNSAEPTASGYRGLYCDDYWGEGAPQARIQPYELFYYTATLPVSNNMGGVFANCSRRLPGGGYAQEYIGRYMVFEVAGYDVYGCIHAGEGMTVSQGMRTCGGSTLKDKIIRNATCPCGQRPDETGSYCVQEPPQTTIEKLSDVILGALRREKYRIRKYPGDDPACYKDITITSSDSGGGGGGSGGGGNCGGGGSSSSGGSSSGSSSGGSGSGGGSGSSGGGSSSGGSGGSSGLSTAVGNPVECSTGAKLSMQSIIPAAGGDQIRLNLSYSSLSREGLPLNNAIDSGPMGGWEITDLQRLRVIEEDLLLMVEMSGHRRFGYLKQGDAFVTDAPSRGAIYRVPGGWSQRDAAGALVEFDTAGLLIRNTFPGGRSRSYGYLPDAQSRPQLSTISDRFGRSLQLFYDGQSRLASAIDAAGESYLLSYAPSGALSRVQYPDGSYREFLYETPSFPLLLTGVIDENGDLYASYGYNSLGLAISTERAGGADRKDIVYVSDVQAEVTERVDEGRTHSRTFGFSYVGFGLRRVTSLTQVPCEGCAGVTQMFAYDSRGVLTSATDAKGVETRYVRDFLGNELSRTDAYGTAEARTVSTIWDSNLRLPLQIEEPGRQTSYAYDTAGRLTSRTVRDTSTQESRTTSYTYNGAGLLQSVDGPRSDVPDITLYTYDTAGNLQTIVNALGQITTVAETNAFGRPLRIVDPNNVETTLTYDLRQRLKTQTVAGQTTRFDYDAAGLLTRVTQPDGATLDYRYDDAHRLFEVEDGNGNRMRYTLDALGNPKLTEALDSQGVVTRRSQRTYDRYGRLWKEIDSLNQAFVRQYDANGNDIAGTDPLSLTTQRAYDALNRLTQSTDPAQGVIQQAYDPRDQLVSVTDPRGLVTGYQRNAFGEILSQQSPDSGTTSYQYDAAGNLASRTDARGITLQYQYDALNRVVLEDAPGTGEDIVYRYDGSNYVGVIANGIGRLTGIVDGSGSRELRYDARGNLLTSKRSLGARTFITSYSYDAASRRSSITYPFGRRIEYARDTQGRVTSIRGVLNGNSVLLADQIVYEPWGAPRSWRLGNGLVVNRTSDLDGRIQRLTAGSLLDRSYTYDAKGRIVGIADGVRPNESQTFTYDPLDRLTTFYSQRWNQLSWGYDPTGNRTVDRVNGGSATHYEYETASNRLIRQTGDSPSIRNYDAAGNQRVQEIRPGAATTLTYTSTYNARGRIVQSVRTGYTPTPAVSFGYDSEGRRAFKGTTEQHYDESGQLLSDTRLNGVSKEYVWLDGLPIAVASRVVGGLTETASDPHRGLNWMYAVPDHLGTVQMLTNDQQAIVWRGAYEPFGRALLDSTNQTTLNLRLPGQYLDDETTTNQNWHREYDRQAGRYVQSDPIGLAGGVNTYAYVGGNPISFIDPEGLRGTIYRGTGDMAGQIWMGNQMRNGAIQNYDSLERRTDRYYGPQLRMTCLVSSCSIPQPANQCSVSNPSGAATQQTSGPVMSAPGQSGCTCMQSSLVLTGQ